MACLQQTLPFKAPGILQGVEKNVKSMGMEDTRNHVLLDIIEPMRIWSYKGTWNLHKSKPGGVPVLRGEVDTSPYPNPELSPLDNHSQGKTRFSPMEYHWVYKPHLRQAYAQLQVMFIDYSQYKMNSTAF